MNAAPAAERNQRNPSSGRSAGWPLRRARIPAPKRISVAPPAIASRAVVPISGHSRHTATIPPTRATEAPRYPSAVAARDGPRTPDDRNSSAARIACAWSEVIRPRSTHADSRRSRSRMGATLFPASWGVNPELTRKLQMLLCCHINAYANSLMSTIVVVGKPAASPWRRFRTCAVRSWVTLR